MALVRALVSIPFSLTTDGMSSAPFLLAQFVFGRIELLCHGIQPTRRGRRYGPSQLNQFLLSIVRQLAFELVCVKRFELHSRILAEA